MTTRLQGLTGATLSSAPTVCHDCVFWQSRPGRTTSKRKWIERAEDDWGAWGTVYADDDGRVLGSMQYGPSELFPRADTLPAGPPDERPFRASVKSTTARAFSPSWLTAIDS